MSQSVPAVAEIISASSFAYMDYYFDRDHLQLLGTVERPDSYFNGYRSQFESHTLEPASVPILEGLSLLHLFRRAQYLPHKLSEPFRLESALLITLITCPIHKGWMQSL